MINGWLMEIGNLVLLQFSDNGMGVELITVAEAKEKNSDLEIDLGKGAWSWKHVNDAPIGRAVDFQYMNGPIGIYDKRDFEHLQQIVTDTSSAIRRNYSY